MLINNTTLEIVNASVLDQDVGAIVNAANTGMRGGGGIDGKIHVAAGKNLLDELTRIAPQGAKTGTAIITPGYNLKQPYIIHTPGPVWQGGNRGEPDLLASSYRSCLEAADAQLLKSIAFCSISTGIFMYPLDKAARLALETVTAYLTAHPNTTLEKIVLAMFGAEEYAAFSQAWAGLSGENV